MKITISWKRKEKKKGNEIKFSGPKFMEFISFKGWLNRKLEDLGLIFPTSFQELEDFVGQVMYKF